MTDFTERRKEIEARKAELQEEVKEATEERLAEITKEGKELNHELEEMRVKEMAEMAERNLEPVVEKRTTEPTMADRFVKEGRMSIPMFKEDRALLASGTIAKPTAVATEIGMLPNVVSSIVDDVTVIDATGTGSWKFPYQATATAAADVTEGSALGGTAGTYNFVEISPAEWGVLTEVSNQIKKMTNANYAAAVQADSYLALRKTAKAKITAAIQASTIVEKRPSIALDEKYIRNIALNYDADESVNGEAKLYLNKADLATLGEVRGTQNKKAVYDIEFKDANNGIIKDGGLAVPFSINSSLETGKQLYGNPKTVKLLLWGPYEVSTDEGGVYFSKNLMAIRGLATANADLCAKNGMQLIGQGVLE